MSMKEGYPGVSGKNNKNEAWINHDKLDDQEEFIREGGAHLNGRSEREDGETQIHEVNLTSEGVLEMLKRSPEIDSSTVDIQVKGTVITLTGVVGDAKEARAVEKVVANIPHVSQVVNKLDVLHGDTV